MTLRPPFPLVWDNSMRSTFIACPRRFSWEYLHHFKFPAPSVDLHAGKAWAGALEVARQEFYGKETPSEQAIAIGLRELFRLYGTFDPGPRNENKSLPRLAIAFAYYFLAFPLESDPAQPIIGPNGPMVEFSFALPLHESLRHPETGDPIIYSGRADMIASYAGAYTVYDDKTTGSLGATWANQWNRRAQFTGYTWAAQAYNIPVSQVLVRGIALLKTTVNHAQALTIRTPHHIKEWHVQAVRDISRAIDCWRSGYWDVNLSDACSSYGGCMFQQPCGSPDPEPWLTGGQYAVRIWNPLTREETEVS